MPAGPPAGRELIDMALFGVAPEFVRASLRLTGVDGGRSAATAARLLAKASRDVADVGADAWRRAYDDLGIASEAVAPATALAAWAAVPGGVPSQGPITDIVHATALRVGCPAAAYDLAAIHGDLWLRPARGVEVFEGLTGRPDTVPINEPVLVDSADHCLARAWHGAQSAVSRCTTATTDAIVHLDWLALDPADAHEQGRALARLLTGFLGGSVSMRLLHRDAAVADWRS